MAGSVSDLQTAIADQTASIANLTAVVGAIQTVDLTQEITDVQANKAAVDAAVATLQSKIPPAAPAPAAQ